MPTMHAPKPVRVLLLSFAIAASTVVLFLFLLSIPRVRRELLDIALKQINSRIEGQLFIEDFSTNLFTYLTLENITAATAETTGDTLHLKRIRVTYFLPSIVHRHINITDITIDNGTVSLFRDAAGNIQFPLLPVNDTEGEGDGEWQFSADTIFITNLQIKFIDLNTDIYAALAVSAVIETPFSTANVTIHGSQGTFSSPQWEGPVDSLFTSATVDQNLLLSVNRFFLKADSASANFQGAIPLFAHQHWDLLATVSVPVNNMPGNFNGNAVQFDGRIIAELTASGPQRAPKGRIITFSENLLIEGFAIDSFIIQSFYSIADSISANLLLRSEALNMDGSAEIHFNGNGENLLSIGDYFLEADFRDAKISELLSRSPFFLSLQPISAEGLVYASGNSKLFEPESVFVAARFQMPPPYGDEPFELLLHTFKSDWDLRAVMGSGNLVQANGRYHNGDLEGAFDGDLTNIQLLSSIFIQPPLAGEIRFSGDLQGPIDQLQLSFFLSSPDLFWQGIQLDTLGAELIYDNGDLFLSRALLSLNAQFSEIPPIELPLQGFLQAQISARGYTDRISISSVIQIDSLIYENLLIESVVTSLSFSDNSLFIHDLIARFSDFSLKGDGALFLHDTVQALFSASLDYQDDPAGAVVLDVTLWNELISGKLDVTRLRTSPFIERTQLPLQEGTMEISLGIQGKRASPDAQLDLLVLQGITRELYSRIQGSFHLHNDTITGRSTLQIFNDKSTLYDDRIHLCLRAPIHYQLSNPIGEGTRVTLFTENFSAGPLITHFLPSVTTRTQFFLESVIHKVDDDWNVSGAANIHIDTLVYREEMMRVDSLASRIVFSGTVDSPRIGLYSSHAVIGYMHLQARLDTLQALFMRDALIIDTLNILFPQQGHFSASAAIPLSWPDHEPFPHGLRVDYNIKNVDLSFASPFIPALRVSGGILHGQGRIRFNETARLCGHLSIDTLMINTDLIDRPIGPVQLAFTLRGNQVTLQGKGALGGPFYKQGKIFFSPTGVDTVNLKFWGEDLRLNYNNSVDLGLQHIKLKGTGSKNRLDSMTGEIHLGETRYYHYLELLDIVDQIRSITVRPALVPPALLEETHLHFDLRLNRNLIVKTNLGRFLLDGGVIIDNKLIDPQINGELRLALARLKYLERELELRDGYIRRFQPAMVDPLIDIRATTSIRAFLFDNQRDYSLGLALHGSLFSPEPILTSYPPLEEEQIINLLTTGTITTLPGFIDAPDEIISIYLGAAVAWRLRNWLNLTNSDISGNLFAEQEEEHLRLTLMERVTERVFITYMINLQNPAIQGIRTHYRLFPFLYTSGSVTTRGEGSLGLWLYLRR